MNGREPERQQPTWIKITLQALSRFRLLLKAAQLGPLASSCPGLHTVFTATPFGPVSVTETVDILLWKFLESFPVFRWGISPFLIP